MNSSTFLKIEVDNFSKFPEVKMPDRKSPSLYEILTGNFTGDLPMEVLNEEDQVILSVLDNIQRILNARAGTVDLLPVD